MLLNLNQLPMPSFYHQPRSVDDLVNQTFGKILDQYGLEHDLFRRWGSDPSHEIRAHELEKKIGAVLRLRSQRPNKDHR
jgi:hypothetical protein